MWVLVMSISHSFLCTWAFDRPSPSQIMYELRVELKFIILYRVGFLGLGPHFGGL